MVDGGTNDRVENDGGFSGVSRSVQCQEKLSQPLQDWLCLRSGMDTRTAQGLFLDDKAEAFAFRYQPFFRKRHGEV